MSSRNKKSKAFPIVLVITLLLIAMTVGLGLAERAMRYYNDHIADDELKRIQAEAVAANEAIRAEDKKAIAEYQEQLRQAVEANANKPWPEAASEGWDLLDLSDYPIGNQTTTVVNRADVLTGGMLLVNQWHSRPDDFDESSILGLGNYFKWKVQVNDSSVSLFKNAADALKEALDAAVAEGVATVKEDGTLLPFMVSEGYRSWNTQNDKFQKAVASLQSRYSGDELIEAAMREVNYPGTSEFNSGLAFTLRLYEAGNTEMNKSKYSPTDQAHWMNENCWKYGLVFRFPQNAWPLDTSMDKSFITGIRSQLNLYRYVGKGNAAAMHYLDFCMEEYIEYLEEHPHIALYEDGQLKYEIYRQFVGNAASFEVVYDRRASSWTTSIDNMGAVITVMEY